MIHRTAMLNPTWEVGDRVDGFLVSFLMNWEPVFSVRSVIKWDLIREVNLKLVRSI